MLVAVVGGGFTRREVVMPRVPKWGRVAAGILGVVLLLPFMLVSLGPTSSEAPTPAPAQGVDDQAPEQAASGIEVDTEPETTSDHITLMGLRASVGTILRAWETQLLSIIH